MTRAGSSTRVRFLTGDAGQVTQTLYYFICEIGNNGTQLACAFNEIIMVTQEMNTVSWDYQSSLYSKIETKISLNNKAYFNFQNAPKANRHGMGAL